MRGSGTGREKRWPGTQVVEIRRDSGTLQMAAAEKGWQVGSPWVDRGAGSWGRSSTCMSREVTSARPLRVATR